MDAKSNNVEIMTQTDENEHNLHSVLTINKAKLADSGKYRCVYDDIQEQVQVKVAYQRKSLFTHHQPTLDQQQLLISTLLVSF